MPQNSAPTNALRDRTRTSFVFITHDIEEAVYLGDRVAVLNGSPGRIEDVISIALPNPRDQGRHPVTDRHGRNYLIENIRHPLAELRIATAHDASLLCARTRCGMPRDGFGLLSAPFQ